MFIELGCSKNWELGSMSFNSIDVAEMLMGCYGMLGLCVVHVLVISAEILLSYRP